MQYTNDTILFMEHDLQKAVNMKLILCIFEQLSGLKINFYKSEIVCFGKAVEQEETYWEIFGCEAGSLPFRYLWGTYTSQETPQLRVEPSGKYV